MNEHRCVKIKLRSPRPHAKASMCIHFEVGGFLRGVETQNECPASNFCPCYHRRKREKNQQCAQLHSNEICVYSSMSASLNTGFLIMRSISFQSLL